MKSINEFIAASAVIIFPASVLVVDKVYGAVFLIVILLGIWQMVTYRKEIFPISKDEKLFFFSLCIVMVTVVITTVVNNTDMARADRFLAPVLAVPAYIFFKRYLFEEKYVWIGLLAGTLIAVVVAIYQVFWQFHVWRAVGAVHEIIFGDLALVMGVMSLAGIGWFKEKKQWLIIIPALAFIAGIAASALSLSRGGWVALPFLLGLIIWYAFKSLSLKKGGGIFALLIIAIGSVYLIPQTGVQKRINLTKENINLYLNSHDVNDESRATSIGKRFEMWKAARIIFYRNVYVGTGWGGYSDQVQDMIRKGEINKSVGKYYHPHNQYLSALAKGGVLGLLGIVILILIPMVVFYRSINFSSKVKIDRLALAGLILLVAYIFFGLSEAILERSRTIIFFSFYLVVFMSLTMNIRQKKNRD